MKGLCQRAPVTVLSALWALWALWLVAAGSSYAQAQTSDQAKTIAGAWTLNHDLSDQPRDRSQEGDQSGGRRRAGGAGRSGGFGRRGGFGGGGFGGASGAMSPDDRQRMRDAMRDVMNPPDRLTISQTDAMVIITTGDGRVTRLAATDKKIKDESTKIERKTKWEGNTLTSEITGMGPRKITETYLIDPEHKQLHVTVQVDNPGRPMVVKRVYDAASPGA